MRYKAQGQRYFGYEQSDPRLRNGLVGHWFGGGSGLQYPDWTGFRFPGTLTGGPRWTLGVDGKRNALSFDGTDDYVNVAATATHEPTSTLTIMAWCRPVGLTGAGGNLRVMSKTDVGDGAVAWSLGLSVSSDVPRFVIRTVSGGAVFLDGPTALPNNIWSHLAGVYDGTNMRLYVNGIRVGTTAQSGVLSYQTARGVRIGAAEISTGVLQYWKGDIDDVRLYYNRIYPEGFIPSIANSGFQSIIPRRRRSAMGSTSLIKFTKLINQAVKRASSY